MKSRKKFLPTYTTFSRARSHIDIVAWQESWEREEKNIVVDGYKWFGKPRKDKSNLTGEGGVGV